RAANDGIADLPQLSGNIFVLHFEIGDGGLATRAPVDDVLAAIDQALFIEADEDFAHGAGKIFVHGKIFAVPVDRGAETLHLVEDGAAVVALPLPDTLDELFAAEVAALLAFLGEVALHHHLRGDAGVIGAGQPESDEAAHAMPAHDDVHLCLVEHVAHVQTSGNVWRRQQQGKNRTGFACGRSGDGEKFLFDPIVGPAGFDRARFVRFWQVVGHEFAVSSSQLAVGKTFNTGSTEGSQVNLLFSMCFVHSWRLPSKYW